MYPTDDLRMTGAGRIGVDPRQRGEGMFTGRSQRRQQSVPRPDAIRRSQAAGGRTPEQDPGDDRITAGGPADDSDRPPEDDNDPDWEDTHSSLYNLF